MLEVYFKSQGGTIELNSLKPILCLNIYTRARTHTYINIYDNKYKIKLIFT